MKTIIVDDEMLAIKQFEMECEKLPWVNIAGKFQNAKQALEYAQKEKIEAAFLDIELPGMNGILLGKKLRELYPKLVVIFLTGYDNYTLDALYMKADYYLMKPYSSKDFQDVMENARLLIRRQKKRVFVRTLGRFDLIIDDQVVDLPNAKAKELFALCVDHKGGHVSMEEAVDKLWEDRIYDERVKNLYRKATMSLRKVFQEYGLEEVFVNKRGSCNINPELMDCDYFDVLEHKKQNLDYKNMLVGTYMPEYSWAEETNAQLLL